LENLREPGVHRRAERLYEQLDEMQRLRRLARHDLLVESRKHSISSKLRQIPYVGPIRAALLIALLQTPHRFRTKRQLWAFSGLALEIHTGGDFDNREGELRRLKKVASIRGLNKDHNHDLKGLYKATATMASMRPGPFREFFLGLLGKGLKPAMARLTLARKIAAITILS
jgi:transposase